MTNTANMDIAALIPHAGRMCLLEDVLDWDASRVRCGTRSHVAADNPLRIGAALPAICGIEYAAQAAAVHGGLTVLSGARPRSGYLVSVRDIVCRCERLDVAGSRLIAEAALMMNDGSTALYGFSLYLDAAVAVSGRLMVVLDGGGATA